MANDKRRDDELPEDVMRREAKRKDAGAGAGNQPGAISGIGGVGGSSGAGGVTATPRGVGDISGIGADLRPEDIPMPGSTTPHGPGHGRDGQMSDGGMPGKTRGAASETVPNQEDADSPDSR